MKKGIIVGIVCLIILGIIVGIVFYSNSQKNIEIDVEELAVKIKYKITGMRINLKIVRIFGMFFCMFNYILSNFINYLFCFKS